MPQPGIALTFDDSYIDEWYKYSPLFKAYGVKATFYISNYNLLNQEQKAKLHFLQSNGHEIAYHSLHHPDFVKYLIKNRLGKLEEEEILKGLLLMNKDGFYPKCFALPYGSHNQQIDNMLLRNFKSIRFLNGTKNYSKSFTVNNSNKELYALGIDLSSDKSDALIENLISLTKTNNNCLVLVGHHIENQKTRMQVPYGRLVSILTKAKELNLKFYTVSEISY
ncbi:MAG: hypothetical protein NVS1B13_00420 [Flavisolibacter sp.]